MSVIEQQRETAEPSVEELDERVANGMAFLDEHVPGWRRRIDRDALDIGSPCDCTLGQLFGDCAKALCELYGDGDKAFDSRRPHRLGFYALDGEWNSLTRAWKRALA